MTVPQAERHSILLSSFCDRWPRARWGSLRGTVGVSFASCALTRFNRHPGGTIGPQRRAHYGTAIQAQIADYAPILESQRARYLRSRLTLEPGFSRYKDREQNARHCGDCSRFADSAMI
jgi:hypothetical protein